jgi:hypothetical protein
MFVHRKTNMRVICRERNSPNSHHNCLFVAGNRKQESAQQVIDEWIGLVQSSESIRREKAFFVTIQWQTYSHSQQKNHKFQTQMIFEKEDQEAQLKKRKLITQFRLFCPKPQMTERSFDWNIFNGRMQSFRVSFVSFCFLFVSSRSRIIVLGESRMSDPVIIVGAGVAGLYAAKLLRDKGLSSVIVEASDYIGGRVKQVHIFYIPLL